MITEKWIDGTEPIVSLGFTGDTAQTVIYIPLREHGIRANRLQAEYTAKVILSTVTGRMLYAITAAIVISDQPREPWAKWTVNARATKQGGIYLFHVRCVNKYLDVLTGTKHRAILFDSIPTGDATENGIRVQRRTW